MKPERITREKSGAFRAAFRKKLAGHPAPANDLGAQLRTVKRPHASGRDLNPEMVRFLRDGACKR
jgi:hypothetical protein